MQTTSVIAYPSPGGNILRGARMNGRVLVALIFREAALRFGSGPIGYVWTLIEPSVLICLMVFARLYIKSSNPAFGDSSTLFLLSGLLSFRLSRNTINQAGRAISGNQTLLGFGPIKPPDLVIARTVVEFAIWLIILTVFFAAMRIMLEQEIITNFQDFVLALVSIFYFCLAFSMFNATVGALVPVWLVLWKIMMMPLLILSGVAYVPVSMPPAIFNIIVWNPFLHCVEALRSASYLDYISVYDAYYLNGFSSIVILLSLTIERLFRKEIMRSKIDTEEDEEYI
jgi:capsular polysaccharide transport system permease protein